MDLNVKHQFGHPAKPLPTITLKPPQPTPKNKCKYSVQVNSTKGIILKMVRSYHSFSRSQRTFWGKPDLTDTHSSSVPSSRGPRALSMGTLCYQNQSLTPLKPHTCHIFLNSTKNNCSSFIFRANYCYFAEAEAVFKNTTISRAFQLGPCEHSPRRFI